jgi:hypothetical protein
MKTKNWMSMLALSLLAISIVNALPFFTSYPLSNDPAEEQLARAQKGPRVKVKMDIGCKKKDCKGICANICGVYIIIVEGLQGGPNGAEAELRLSDNGRPIFSFPRQKMDPEFEQNFLGDGTFQLDEPFDLTEDIASELGKTSLRLPAGEFPIREFPDRYEVTF